MYAIVVGSLVHIEHIGVIFNDVFEEIYYEECYFLNPSSYCLLGLKKKICTLIKHKITSHLSIPRLQLHQSSSFQRHITQTDLHLVLMYSVALRSVYLGQERVVPKMIHM